MSVALVESTKRADNPKSQKPPSAAERGFGNTRQACALCCVPSRAACGLPNCGVCTRQTIPGGVESPQIGNSRPASLWTRVSRNDPSHLENSAARGRRRYRGQGGVRVDRTSTVPAGRCESASSVTWALGGVRRGDHMPRQGVRAMCQCRILKIRTRANLSVADTFGQRPTTKVDADRRATGMSAEEAVRTPRSRRRIFSISQASARTRRRRLLRARTFPAAMRTISPKCFARRSRISSFPSAR